MTTSPTRENPMSAQERICSFAQNQAVETEVIPVMKGNFSYRYAYARSAECQQNGDPGQDYLIFREDGRRMVFALCDGVSQSFFGDLAARFLGDNLLEWLWNQSTLDADKIGSTLQAYLADLRSAAAQQVASTRLPEDIPDMLRSVLEEKRALGSETMLVGGLVDFAQRRAILVLLGDMRLRVWDSNNEITGELGLTPKTSERWSTLHGPLGTVHVQEISLDKMYSIVAYSDGLARIDKAPVSKLSDRAIQELINLTFDTPASDDISFFQLWLGKAPQYRASLVAPVAKFVNQKGNRTLLWESVPGASEYEILISGAKQQHIHLSGNSWTVPSDLALIGSEIKVRAWGGDEPGAWSEALTVEQGGSTSFQPNSQSADLASVENLPAALPLVSRPRLVARQEIKPERKTSRHTSLKWALAIIPVFLLCGAAFFWVVAGPSSFLVTATPTMTETRIPTRRPTRVPARSFTPSPTIKVTVNTIQTKTVIGLPSPSIIQTMEKSLTGTEMSQPVDMASQTPRLSTVLAASSTPTAISINTTLESQWIATGTPKPNALASKTPGTSKKTLSVDPLPVESSSPTHTTTTP